MAEAIHPANGHSPLLDFLFIEGDYESNEELVEDCQLGGEKMEALLVIDVQNGIVRTGDFSDELQKMEKVIMDFKDRGRR